MRISDWSSDVCSSDLVTVVIAVDDKAQLENASVRSRVNAEDASAGALLGYEQALDQVLPEAINPSKLFDLDSSRSEEHTSELQSLMRLSYAVFCLQKKKLLIIHITTCYNNN